MKSVLAAEPAVLLELKSVRIVLLVLLRVVISLLALGAYQSNLNSCIISHLAGDFKNGITFDMDGAVFQVIEFQHVKPGKGAAFVRTKIKNVITGAVIERTFSPTDKFENAYIERREMQYSYNDGDLYYFMDMESFEMLPLNSDKLPESFKFVKEEMMCKIISYKGNVFGVEPPTFVELAVTQTDPGFAGNTATNTLKPATLETGAVIKVPLFINEGEVLKIDTRTGEYLSRA